LTRQSKASWAGLVRQQQRLHELLNTDETDENENSLTKV